MSFFRRKKADPVELLDGLIVGYRTVWDMSGSMPPAQLSASLKNIPNGLREEYQEAHAMDPDRADSLITQARANPPTSHHPQMTWNALLDYAVAQHVKP